MTTWSRVLLYKASATRARKAQVSWTRKSAQVDYPQDLCTFNSNSSRGYYWFQPYSTTVTNPERGQSAIWPIVHLVPWQELYLVGMVTITSRARLFFCAEKWHKANYVAVWQVIHRSYHGHLKFRPHQPFELPFSRAATCTHGRIFE